MCTPTRIDKSLPTLDMLFDVINALSDKINEQISNLQADLYDNKLAVDQRLSGLGLVQYVHMPLPQLLQHPRGLLAYAGRTLA